MRLIEYRVRPVTRYIVTRFESCDDDPPYFGSSCGTMGEYENYDIALAVGNALCRVEHQGLGWPIDDQRIRYPQALIPAGSQV